jgi:hypothetical protein
VRSTPALPIVDPVLPFTVIDAAAAPGHGGGASAVPAIALRQAQGDIGALQGDGRGNSNGVVLPQAANVTPLPVVEQAQLPPPVVEPQAEPTIVSLHLTDERLAWIARYLEEGKFGGLIPHLMVLRALFPDDASGADAAVRQHLRDHAERFNELADRLFIKLRLPDCDIVPEDLETETFRTSLRDAVDAIRLLAAPAPYEANGLRLIGAVRGDELAAASAALTDAPLVTATPWLAMTLLLGSSLERDGHVIADLGAYRTALSRQLVGMRDLGPEEFVEAALLQPVDPELDAERGDLIRALSAQLAETAA